MFWFQGFGRCSAAPAPPRAGLGRFLLARDGNVLIIFALSLLPIIGLIGLSVDIGRVMAAKSALDSSADAAALATVTQANSLDQTSANIGAYDGEWSGSTIFQADAAKVGAWIGGTPVPTIRFSKSGLNLTATVSYTASIPAVFGVIFGRKAYQVSGSASASLAANKYIDIALAIDISQSMGLGASQSDIDQLMQHTPDQCAFGCHALQQSQLGGNSRPYEAIAHSIPVQLRIDVIKQVTQKMIQSAQIASQNANLIAFTLYTLQYGANQVSQRNSTDYSALASQAALIDLGDNQAAGIGDTNFPDSLPLLTQDVGYSGDGSTPTSRKQYVLLMTDGVQDVSGPCMPSGHCTAPLDPTQCDQLKANGVTVGVVYTTYLPMPDDPRYQLLVEPFADKIAPNLKACASPGWFYQASNAADIQSAMNALFTQVVGHGILTQ